MELDLFDFDFSESNADMFSEEKVLASFRQLQKLFREKQNAYYMRTTEMSRDILMHLNECHNRGWLEKRGRSGINIPDDYLAHYTADELIAGYRDAMNCVLNRPGISWYNHVLPVMNHSPFPIRWESEKIRHEVSQAKKEIDKQTAQSLGLKHFLDVPASRGMRMNALDAKWAEKHVVPKVAELVMPITDFDGMKALFQNHAFFCGRRDWDVGPSRVPIAPYPVFKRLMPNVFETACLCEAEDEKTVTRILGYTGCASGNFEHLNPDITYIYPDGWSMKKYEATLTDDDIELIIDDQERLKKLHFHN